MMLKTDWTTGNAWLLPEGLDFEVLDDIVPVISALSDTVQHPIMGTYVDVNLENNFSTMLSSDSLAFMTISARSCNFLSPAAV
ncbi:hypothetical protein PUNSTDRAFT_118996 [Punctularia strigosozonata HHB-11173 SS5]|uniref:uncharacterized protein n=1 Tax=Punctularia strigosozonata (strain HHB-11173) TaxID=741275 RepID=UPI0004417E42|nr:uncharacterized protein PUNSTDRAFT_118996 [Punctularia strigosozonata HHB-11173 SS5]EIN11729.1 hypothetical protein PUNSTDRAFT_118996 [Punctularia strigosozonata HHB-11173 SS5]